MQPPLKDQSMLGVDNPKIDAAATDDNKDYTRQEYKNEADINYMLSRFGITQPRGVPVYGEWDDTIDLLTALTAVRDAQDAYQLVPEELRKKFKSMEELLTAVENGSLVLKDDPAPQPKDLSPPEPAAPPPAPA